MSAERAARLERPRVLILSAPYGAGHLRAAEALAQVEFWVRPTRNPALVARWDRLERRLHPPPDPDAMGSANDVVTEMVEVETVHHDTVVEPGSASS